MATARVDSIDALKTFRVALIKFAEEANSALAGAEAEMQRIIGWLEREQLSFWQLQIRKRQEALGRAQEALRMKKLFPDASGRTPTPVEEEKAVRRCKAALEEAEQKLANVKKYTRVMQREVMNYKGGVQRFSTWVGSEVPVAIGLLDRMAGKLEEYVALKVPGGYSPVREASASAFTGSDGAAPVSRGAADASPRTVDPFFPILTPGQAAVLHLDAGAGTELNVAGMPFQGQGEKYQTFDNAGAAHDYAAQKERDDPRIRCMVFDARGQRLPAPGAASGEASHADE